MKTQRFAHRFVRSGCIVLALLLVLTTPALAAFTPSNGQAAKLVLGQPDFTSNAFHTTQTGMDYPYAVAVDPTTRKVFVADCSNNRVLRFASVYVLNNGAAAESVLGQPNFTSSGLAAAQNKMNCPSGVSVDAGGRLWVADWGNNRVLRFDKAASKANGANADGVLGQPDFTSSGTATSQKVMKYPTGVAIDNATGRLYVSDHDNDRILVFNAAAGLANGANASYVLGQKDFTTGTPNTGGVSATGLHGPVGEFYDPDSKVLLVVDSENSRLLMYGNPFTSFSSTSTAANDGWVLESAAASGKGGSLGATSDLRAGDNASNRRFRSILSFDTASLPDNAVIHSVTLKIKKAFAIGTDPLTSNSLGSLLADIKKGSFGATTLEVGDFQTASSFSAVANFSSIDAGWYKLVLPASDFTYVNLSGVTQFRLRFSSASNNNNVADYDSFYAGDATAAADRPVLSVQYYLP